jgi:hypothetical protein
MYSKLNDSYQKLIKALELFSSWFSFCINKC